MDVARVLRWSQTESPDEHALRRQLLDEGLEPYRWSNEPGTTYTEHRHTYVKVLYVVRGSITFILTEHKRSVQLGPGDRLELAAYTNHTAVVGPAGVVCLESAVPI